MKKQFIHCLALAAMLLAAQSGNAQVVFDFKKWAQQAGVSDFTDYLGTEKTTNEAGAELTVMKDLASGDATLSLMGHLAVSSDIETSVYRFTSASNFPGFICNGTSENEHTYFSVINLKAGDKVRVVYNGTVLRYCNANATFFDNEGQEQTTDPNVDWNDVKPKNEKGGNAIVAYAEDGSAEYGTPELTVKEDGQIDFELQPGSQYHGIIRIYLTTTVDQVFAPTAVRAIGAHYGERTVVIDCPKTSTGGTPTVWYTTDGTSLLSGLADEVYEYSPDETIIIDKTTTFHAVALAESGQISDELVATVEAGTTLRMPTPRLTQDAAELTAINKNLSLSKVTENNGRFFSPFMAIVNTNSLIGMPNAFIVDADHPTDTIKGRWFAGNTYAIEVKPTGKQMTVRTVYEGYEDSEEVTIDGLDEYVRRQLIDITTFEPNDKMHFVDQILWDNEKWHFDTLAVELQPRFYAIDDTLAFANLALGSTEFALAQGIGLLNTGSLTAGNAVNTISVDENLVGISDEEDVEFVYITQSSGPLSLWRSNSHRLGNSIQVPGAWNMALQQVNAYRLKNDADGIVTVKENSGLSACWYTLRGQRIAKPHAKGIYVHEGRKVIVK